MLQGLRYFNAAWARFASLDGDGDRKLVTAATRFAVVTYRCQHRRSLRLLRLLLLAAAAAALSAADAVGPATAQIAFLSAFALIPTRLRASGRLSLQEFTSGCVVLGMRLSREKAEQLFREMDADGGGYVLFDEFCAWCVRQAGFEDGASEDEETEDSRFAINDDGEDEEDAEASLYGVAPERGAM